MQTLSAIKQELKQRDCFLQLCSQSDVDALYEIFREVVDTGTYFPYEVSSQEEFLRRFFAPDTQVYVCRNLEGKVLGGFYLKSNYGGRSRHIANAAYMIGTEHRGKGLGKLLTQASLTLAKESGFTAMQYNMVLSANERAISLYKKLGFKIIATIPDAVRNIDGTFQAGLIMYRSLKESHVTV